MVGEKSKLPEVQAEVVVPKLARRVVRSVASTLPSMLVSPRSSGERRREFESAGLLPKVGLLRWALLVKVLKRKASPVAPDMRPPGRVVALAWKMLVEGSEMKLLPV